MVALLVAGTAALAPGADSAVITEDQKPLGYFQATTVYNTHASGNYHVITRRIILRNLYEENPWLRASSLVPTVEFIDRYCADKLSKRDLNFGEQLLYAFEGLDKALLNFAGSTPDIKGLDAVGIGTHLYEALLASVPGNVPMARLSEYKTAYLEKQMASQWPDMLHDDWLMATSDEGAEYAAAWNMLIAPETKSLIGESVETNMSYNGDFELAMMVEDIHTKIGEVLAELKKPGDSVVDLDGVKSEMEPVVEEVNAISADSLAEAKAIDDQQHNMIQYQPDPAELQRRKDKHEANMRLIQGYGGCASFLSSVIGLADPALANDFSIVANSGLQIAGALSQYMVDSCDPKIEGMATFLLTGNILGVAGQLFSLFGDQSSPEAEILAQIAELRQQVEDVRVEMHGRFDRVDEELNQIYARIDDVLEYLGQTIPEIQTNLQYIYAQLSEIDNDIRFMNQRMWEFADDEYKQDFLDAVDGLIGLERRLPGTVLPFYPDYSQTGEVGFHRWAYDRSKGAILGGPTSRDYSDSGVYEELTTYPLDVSINYFSQYPAYGLSPVSPPLSTSRLANPKAWAAGVEAYLQLAREWPWYAARVSTDRLDLLAATGMELQNAVEGILDGPTVKGTLLDALLAKYGAKLGELELSTAQAEVSYMAANAIVGVDLWGGGTQASSYSPSMPATIPAHGVSPTYNTPGNLQRIPSIYRLADQLGLVDLTLSIDSWEWVEEGARYHAHYWSDGDWHTYATNHLMSCAEAWDIRGLGSPFRQVEERTGKLRVSLGLYSGSERLCRLSAVTAPELRRGWSSIYSYVDYDWSICNVYTNSSGDPGGSEFSWSLRTPTLDGANSRCSLLYNWDSGCSPTLVQVGSKSPLFSPPPPTVFTAPQSICNLNMKSRWQSSAYQETLRTQEQTYRDELCTAVEVRLKEHQAELYLYILNDPPVRQVMEELAGIKYLIAGCVQFAMSRQMDDNEYLRALVVGDQGPFDVWQMQNVYATAISDLAAGNSVTKVDLLAPAEVRIGALEDHLETLLGDVPEGVAKGSLYVIDELLGQISMRKAATKALASPDCFEAAAGATLVEQASGVLADDTHQIGITLTAVLESGPTHGTLALHPDGGFSYTPVDGFAGWDSFEYRATDGFTQSDPVMVQILVLANVPDLKPCVDDTLVANKNYIVTAAFPGFFYVSVPDRSHGIRVELDSYEATVGHRVLVTGRMITTPDGERAVQADRVSAVDTAFVSPLALPVRSVGGGYLGYNPSTGAGQRGVRNGSGLNNIGLLLKVTGRVTYVDPAGEFFNMSDGGPCADPSGNPGVRVLPYGNALPGVGDLVSVIGASSCLKSGDDLYPLVRATAIQVLRKWAFDDGFEGPAIDPFWSSGIDAFGDTYHSPALTAETARSGDQSLKLAWVYPGPYPGTGVFHIFPSPVRGKLSVYFYDSDTGAVSTYSGMRAFNTSVPWGQPTCSLGVAVMDWDPWYYYYGNGVESFIGPSRSAGWHHFVIDVQADGYRAYIDDALMKFWPGSYSFDEVVLYNGGGYADSTYYFDDFTFVPEQ